MVMLCLALAESGDDTGDSVERPEWVDTAAITTEVFVQEPAAGCAGAVAAGLAVGALASLPRRHPP